MEEVWKDIPRYEGKYCVSNTGKVKSLFRMVRHRLGGMKSVPERILKPDGDGYKRRYRSVMFGDRKRMLVHRLVAIAFIPNPLNKPCVNHIDGNPQNNHVSNLEWCTYAENEHHSFAVLGKKLLNLHSIGKTGKLSKSSIPVIQYKDGVEIARFDSACEAARALGASQGEISTVCRGERSRCRGFEFKYIGPPRKLRVQMGK